MGATTWGGIKKMSESPFLKIAGNTEVQLRVISEVPHVYKIHYVGEAEETERIVCPEANCPICKMGQGPSVRYAAVVYVRKMKAVKILEGGIQIFGGFRDYAENEKWGDLRRYDVVVKRVGTGKNDTKYSVMPEPKEPLTKNEIEFIKKNMVNLSKAYAPLSTEEIREKVGGVQTKSENVSTEPDFNAEDEFPG